MLSPMKRKITVLLCLLAVFALALTACAPTEATQQSPTSTTQQSSVIHTEAASGPTLQVVGESTIVSKPDTVYLNFDASNTSKTATDAASQNAQLVEKIVNQLVGVGIAKENISTSQYTLYPEYNYNTNPATLTGYQASTTLVVKTNDIAQTGKYIDAAIAAGAGVSYGMTFALENDQEVYAQAIEQACKDAKSKADTTATANGKKVGAILSVSEGYTASSVESPTKAVLESGAAMDSSTTIYPSQIQITATVTIVYELV